MSAAPDLMTRIANLERERNEARATVARVRDVIAYYADEEPKWKSVPVDHLRDALDPPE